MENPSAHVREDPGLKQQACVRAFKMIQFLLLLAITLHARGQVFVLQRVFVGVGIQNDVGHSLSECTAHNPADRGPAGQQTEEDG